MSTSYGERCPIRWNEQSKCNECGRAIHGWVHADTIGDGQHVIHDWGWSHEGEPADHHPATPVAPVGLADPEMVP